jgi:hypothetical protein
MMVAGLRVDQHNPVSEFSQSLDRLRAGVIKFSGLPNDNRARARDEDGEGSVHGFLLSWDDT